MSYYLRLPWLLAFMAVVLAYNIATLGRVPAFLNDDDGAYASAAFRFWQTGRPGVLDSVSGPTGWLHEQRKKDWRYGVAHGDFRRFLDPKVALEDLVASDAYRNDAARIRQARASSLDRCSVNQRMEGACGTILVLRVRPSGE